MQEETSFKRSLGLVDATMIVAGSMIGSGIFIVSADMARSVGSGSWLILLWVITGIMTVFAAISYGELSSMFPKAGGQYVYLKEAYNPLVGFLYGWSFFSVIQTGTIAAVGVAFSKFAGHFIPALRMEDSNILFSIGGWLRIYPAQILSIVLIVLLTWVNTRGVKEGKIIHSELHINENCIIYLVDILSEEHDSKNVNILLELENEEEINKIYALLKNKGSVKFELQKTFWGAYHAVVTDINGIIWGLNYSNN